MYSLVPTRLSPDAFHARIYAGEILRFDRLAAMQALVALSRTAEYDSAPFYEAWRLAIQRYGIFNPYTGRGAVPGLLPHGPHNVRDLLATHILKQTVS